MENFKAASKQKLRFVTPKGLLSTEQLWDLSLEELDSLAISLEAESKDSEKKSFLTKRSEEDKTAKLKFEVVLDVLKTKVDEQEIAAKALEVKEHNKKIISLIAEKQDESLKGKSIAELEAMLQ